MLNQTMVMSTTLHHKMAVMTMTHCTRSFQPKPSVDDPSDDEYDYKEEDLLGEAVMGFVDHESGDNEDERDDNREDNPTSVKEMSYSWMF